MAEQYKRRRIPIVDRAFQFKYTAIIVGVAAVTSTVLGVFLLRAYLTMNEMIALQQVISEQLGEKLRADDTSDVFGIIVGALVGEVVVLGMLGLLITHRVCGPVFVITRHLQTMAEGRLPALRPLRAGDEFASMFESFKLLIDKTKQRGQDDLQRLEGVLQAARGGGLQPGDVDLLQAIVDEHKARLATAEADGQAS
jgi:methyl-accepting chemotaxis protein